jgi:hypothetical protein
MTTEQITLLICLLLVTLGFWLLRKTPFGFLWWVWKQFFIIFVAVFLADYAKKELKGWWEKD